MSAADTYLITGATGSIGSAVARYLYRQGATVRVFVRSEWKFRNFFPEETSTESERKFEIVVGDILQRDNLIPAMQNITAVFHCTNFPITAFERNVTATKNVLELALEQGSHVIYPGNVWVYGKPRSIPIKEDHPKRPCSELGKIKLRIDEMCLEYLHKHQLPVTILHLPDFYGPYVLNSWMKGNYEAAYSGKPMNMLGNMYKQHELIYIEDAAKALCSVANCEEAYGQYYNVPGSGGITLKDFSNYLYEAAGTTGTIRITPPWSLRAMGLFNKEMRAFLDLLYLFEEEILLDGSKIKGDFGYVPEVDYRIGTQRTMYWYQKAKTESSSLSL
jgi:nucleoside-diphosphate-sugar epimerase